MIKGWVRYKNTTEYLSNLLPLHQTKLMTTTTAYPIQSIVSALDILQEHGVINDNVADHSLACWLEENGLTVDDLNAEPATSN